MSFYQEDMRFEPTPDEQKRIALSYITDAWIEAVLDGIDPDQFARATLEAAIKELVAQWGEGDAAKYVAQLIPQIESFEYSDQGVRQ